MSEDCLGARFEILLDGKTQSCRDTMLTAMGAATFLEESEPQQQGGGERLADWPADRVGDDAASLTESWRSIAPLNSQNASGLR